MKSFIQSVFLLIAVFKLTTGVEEVIYAQEGEQVTLQSNPPAESYLYWFLDGQEVAWRNRFGGTKVNSGFGNITVSGNVLVIQRMQKPYFSTFSCETSQSTDSRRYKASFKLVKLNVNKRPTSLLLPGDPMSLSCSVDTRTHKTPEIYWLNPQGVKINSGDVAETAKHEFNGQWTCVVANDGKEKRAHVAVRVIGLAPGPSHSQYTSNSSPVIVPCFIPADISWKQITDAGVEALHWDFIPSPGSALPPRHKQRLFSLSLRDSVAEKPEQQMGLTLVQDLKKGNLSLTGATGREENTGDYVCSLKFSKGVTLNVTVHVHLLQITPSPAARLHSGQQLNLTCGAGHPLPSDLQLKWLSPNPSRLPPGPHPAQLTLPEVGTEDGGVWRCELWRNNIRLTSAVITLEIENLNVWMLVIICSATVIVVLLLLILSVTVYRRRQRKMRHLRHRLCNCKNPRPKGFYRT